MSFEKMSSNEDGNLEVNEDCTSTNITKHTKKQRFNFITLAVGNFCLGANASLQAPFFPQEAENKGADPVEYSLVFSIYQLSLFVASFFMAKLTSYVEPKFLLNAGLLTNGLMCILFGLLDYVEGKTMFVCLALTFRILEGFGAAAVRTSAYTIVITQFPENMATSVAFLQTSLGVGLITGSAIGGALYDLGGFGLPFYFIGTCAVLDAGAIFALLPKSGCSTDNKKGKLLKFWMHPSTFIHALAVFSAYTFIGYNHVTLEPHLRQFHLRAVYVGLMFTIHGLFFAITSPCWGWLCDKKCNEDLITTCGYLLLITSLLLIGPMPFLKLENGILIVICALVLAGVAIGAQNVSSFSGSLKDAEARGFPNDVNTFALTSSMIASSQSLGAFTGPSVGGYFLENVGYNAGTTVLFFTNISFLIIHLFYTLIIKRKIMFQGEFRRQEEAMEKLPILQSNNNNLNNEDK